MKPETLNPKNLMNPLKEPLKSTLMDPFKGTQLSLGKSGGQEGSREASSQPPEDESSSAGLSSMAYREFPKIGDPTNIVPYRAGSF